MGIMVYSFVWVMQDLYHPPVTGLRVPVMGPEWAQQHAGPETLEFVFSARALLK